MKPLIGQSRATHCHLDSYYGLLQYRLLYPFEEEARGYYSYEIDKDRKKFVVVGLDQDSEESEEEDDAEDERVDTSNTDSDEYERSVRNDGKDLDAELADLADNLRLEGGNEEQATGLAEQRTEDLLKEMMQDRNYRYSCYISSCILNNVHDIEDLLRRYNDPFILERDENGDNGVSLAATEGAMDALVYLHSRGADLNNVNKQGRTPLMQASLWGRIQVVDFLLSKHVSVQLRDRKGKSALDLARPNRKNSMERRGHPEKTDADMCRRIIWLKIGAGIEIEILFLKSTRIPLPPCPDR